MEGLAWEEFGTRLWPDRSPRSTRLSELGLVSSLFPLQRFNVILQHEKLNKSASLSGASPSLTPERHQRHRGSFLERQPSLPRRDTDTGEDTRDVSPSLCPPGSVFAQFFTSLLTGSDGGRPGAPQTAGLQPS